MKSEAFFLLLFLSSLSLDGL